MPHEQKILITSFGRGNGISGSEKQAIKLVEKLQERGCWFFLLSDNEDFVREFADRHWFGRGFWLGEGSQTIFLILYVFSLLSALYALAYFRIARGVRKIYCLTLPDKLIMTPVAKLLGYEVFWQESKSMISLVNKPVYLFFYKFAARFARIIASFGYIQKELVGIDCINPENHLRIIHPGVDLESYKKQSDIFDAMASRNLLFEEKANFKIGCVSDLENNFGVEYLIKAMLILNEKTNNFKLTIVGDGAQRENMLWLIKEFKMEDKIKIAGYDGDILDWIFGFDALVSPGVNETDELTLIEAMACEVPAVATEAGGNREIIDNEKCGFIVESANSQALADAILKLMNDRSLTERLAKAGKEKAERFHSMERMVGDYHDTFSSM
ncbi:MAG: glycosyltransferase family 4 protein [Parcubacteria group bacterium]